LAADERDYLNGVGRHRAIRRNTLIYSQGDPPGSTYIVESGMVRTFRLSRDGREFTVGFWPRHEIIGGPDIFTTEPRMLSAEAVSDSVLLGFSAQDLEHLVDHIPRFARNLIAALSFKSRWMMHVSNILGTRSALQRIVHVVLLQADVHGDTTPEGRRVITHLSHNDIALLVGASRQWVTQALADLERNGLIEYRSRRIVLIDETELERLADM
jgi:CRP-like cAMP-binding protein